MATDALTTSAGESARRDRSAHHRRASPGSDRVSVVLLTIAGFLVVLALLAQGLPAAPSARQPHVLVLRKIYRTTVVESMSGGTGGSGTSVTQSVSNSGAGAGTVAPTTHVS